MVNLNDHEATLAVAEIEAKEAVKDLYCTIHKRKGRVSFDFDNLGCNAYIKGCCVEHVQKMQDAIAETQMFNKIEIEDVAHK